jgi:hypothetical protein
MKSQACGLAALLSFLVLRYNKTPIQNRFVLPRKAGITPTFEFLYLFGHE